MRMKWSDTRHMYVFQHKKIYHYTILRLKPPYNTLAITRRKIEVTISGQYRQLQTLANYNA